MNTIRGAIPGALAMLLSMPAAAQGPIASDQPASGTGPFMEPTMMRVVPDPDEMYPVPGIAPALPYSCYRIGRCSAYDLYRFRDRPNWLTRRAPGAPPESGTADGTVSSYSWFFVPVTPEENILPKYRTASQVRAEHRSVSRPIQGPD